MYYCYRKADLGSLNLRGAVIEDLEVRMLDEKKRDATVFRFQIVKQGTLTMYAESKEEKDAWVQILSEVAAVVPDRPSSTPALTRPKSSRPLSSDVTPPPANVEIPKLATAGSGRSNIFSANLGRIRSSTTSSSGKASDAVPVAQLISPGAVFVAQVIVPGIVKHSLRMIC